MTSPQEQVAQLVTDRGYRQGWTPEQFAARQVVKLQEELGELAVCFIFKAPKTVRGMIWCAHNEAQDAFHRAPHWWIETTHASIQAAKLELADIQVVVFTLAQALSELSSEPFDVVQAALDKAGRDVERGIRKDG